MKKPPFKKLDCRLIDKLLLLPANALKVWLCHFNHEGANRLSYPSLERLCEKTGLNSKTVKVQRKWLIEHGWLKKTGERSGNGKFKVPVMTVLPGTLPQEKPDGRVKNRVPSTAVVQNLGHGNRGPNFSGHETKTLPTAGDQKLAPKVKLVEVNQLGVEIDPKPAMLSACTNVRDTANSKSLSVHSQGATAPARVAALAGNSCTNTEISHEPELTPRQVLERFQHTLLKLHEQRANCATEASRDDLDQLIAAAEWALHQQEARMEKEGAVA